MAVPRYKPEFIPPTEDQLKEMALKFVKGSKPKEYKRMKAEGELEEYLRLKAKATREHAEDLIAGGEWNKQAWATAERIVLLEANSD
jgi:hypothetical protein